MSEPAGEQKVMQARTRMAELAEKFLVRTATDIASMRADLVRLSAGETAALAELRHLAHRMVGTGATLGFESLSECARRIEHLVEGCVPGTMPDPAVREELAGALEALATEYGKQRG